MDIELTHNELADMMKPVTGDGGFQSFQRRLQRSIHGRTLSLSDDDLERAWTYCKCYGTPGGWQGRLMTILERALHPEIPTQRDLF